ncbi:MAG: hypothetical protein IJZ85_02590 [Lachnospiraceae bacterium]|nr:hypothetical protein [Lachnospiraceae bacterium]
MKKAYVKPEIMFENFSLSTNIAGDCEGIVGNPSKGTCAVLGTGGIAVFDSKVGSACEYTPTEMGGTEDQWDGACYHVPTEYNNLFNS